MPEVREVLWTVYYLAWFMFVYCVDCNTRINPEDQEDFFLRGLYADATGPHLDPDKDFIYLLPPETTKGLLPFRVGPQHATLTLGQGGSTLLWPAAQLPGLDLGDGGDAAFLKTGIRWKGTHTDGRRLFLDLGCVVLEVRAAHISRPLSV